MVFRGLSVPVIPAVMRRQSLQSDPIAELGDKSSERAFAYPWLTQPAGGNTEQALYFTKSKI
jgi:hypothetical protein